MSDLISQEMHNKTHSFIISALLAVEDARIKGDIGKGESAASKFLRQWLKKVQRQKRFSRDLAGLIARFIDDCSTACLLQTIRADFYVIDREYRTLRVKNVVHDKTELERLDRALELLKTMDINVQVPLDYNTELDGPYQNKSNKEVFILKTDFDLSVFEEELTEPLNIYVVGERQMTIDVFYSNGLIAEIANQNVSNGIALCHLRIYPQNQISGKVAIPSKFL